MNKKMTTNCTCMRVVLMAALGMIIQLVFPIDPADAAILVGPPAAPAGIDGLSITYSGGTKLFDVRFDERSFNDAVTPVPDPTTVLPFLSSVDTNLALTAVDDFLNGLGITGVGAAVSYDGVLNTNLFYMYGGFTSTHFKDRQYHTSGFGSWGYGGDFTDENPIYLRSSPISSWGSANALAVFTTASASEIPHAPAPGAGLIAAMGAAFANWARRKRILQ